MNRRKSTQISNVMKILTLGVEFHVGGEIYTDMKLIVAFRGFVNTPEHHSLRFIRSYF
jgi:hypothetical protein